LDVVCCDRQQPLSEIVSQLSICHTTIQSHVIRVCHSSFNNHIAPKESFLVISIEQTCLHIENLCKIEEDYKRFVAASSQNKGMRRKSVILFD
jgi:hypothetical protein